MAETLTFVLEGRDRLSRVLDGAGNSASALEKKLLLISAAAPAAAALAPLIAQTGAATVAVAAFGAAVIPQISALSDASAAQKKYETAVRVSGSRSEAAVTAQKEYLRQLAAMPPATQRAAVAVSDLKDEYKSWSDALADDTMPVFNKGVAVAESLLPKLTPMVKGASTELDRLLTLAAGGMETSSFDRFMDTFSDFAVGSLRRANDGLVHLSRTLDSGSTDSGIARFMDFAHTQGPLVADTLRNVAAAALNVLQAASETGVGVLTLANAAAKLVTSLPPGFIALLLQAALAIRAVNLAIAGVQLAAGGLTLVRTQIAAAGTAAIGTSGSIATLKAAFMAMSLSARTAVAATGIGLLVLGLIKLSSIGKKTPPDVDRLTTSLGNLARTGQASGEAARAYGKDLSGLGDSLRTLARPSNAEGVQQWMTKLIGMDSTPVKDAKENLDAVDKSLANLVKNGNPKLAEAAFNQIAAAMKKQGMTSDELRGQLDNYKSALADQAFEQSVAAQSMGLFGTQAQQVQAKLDAQKASADGLRQSLQALNDVNRAGLGGMIGFEAAIDAATRAAKDNAGALSMSHGQLNLNSKKAQAAATALNDLAAKTDTATAAARDSGASWSAVNKIYDRGRTKLIASAMAMGLTKKEAEKLAGQILKTPDKTVRLRGNLDDLKDKLAKAKAQLRTVPDSRRAQLRADIAQLKAAIRQAKYELANLHDKTVTVYYSQVRNKGYAGNSATGGKAMGGMIHGPGTGTSDDVPIMASNGEYMIKAASVSKYGVRFLDALNNGTLRAFAKGGRVTKGISKSALSSIRTDTAHRMVVELTGSTSQINSMVKELVGDIERAFKGKKTRVDDHLVSMLEKGNKRLRTLAAERDKIAAKIKEAKAFASSVTSTAKGTATLSSLGEDSLTGHGGGVVAGLQSKLANLRQFSRYISILAKRGLNKVMLREILEMGPESGFAYASELVGSSKKTISEINGLQSQIGKDSKALGNKGADLLYDSGKNAGKGFLKGLEGQQAAIEKLMLNIAKGMQKAIRKALDINSPSRVMAWLGARTTDGLGVGAISRIPALKHAMTKVADVVAGTQVAFGQPVVGRPAVSGGGVTNVYINVDGALDPIAVAKQLQKILLGLKRTNGVNINLGVG